MVHNRWSGMANMLQKDQLLMEIEGQMEHGNGLLTEDQYSSGDTHEYWLLAVKGAQLAKTLAQGVGRWCGLSIACNPRVTPALWKEVPHL